MGKAVEHAKRQARLSKPKEGGGFLDRVRRYASVIDQAGWETLAGVGDVATLGPLSLAITHAMGNSDLPFREGAKSMGLIREDREPQTPGERRAATATEYAVGSMLPIPGAVKAAQVLGPGRGAARTMLKPFLDAPGKAALAETAAGVGAGTAAGITREAYPDSPSAELAAGVAGGLVPGAVAGATRAVARRAGPEVIGTLGGAAGGYAVGGPGGAAVGATGGGFAGRALHQTKAGRPAARAVAAKAEARQTMQRTVADPDAAQARLDPAELTDVVPDAQPTSAATSREKGIRTMESDLYRNDPVFASKIDARKEQNRVAVRRAFGSTEPDGPTASETRDMVRRAVDDDLAQLDETVAQIKRDAEMPRAEVERSQTASVTAHEDSVALARREARRGMSAADASEMYYSDLSKAASEFYEQSSRLYDGVDPNGRLFLDADDHIGPAARQIVDKTKRPEQGSVPNLARIAADYEGPQSYEEILSFRRAINAELNAASKDPARRIEARLLTKLKKSVNATFNDLEESGNMSAEAVRHREANRYFQEGAKIFRDGQAGRVLEPSRSPVPESATLSKFVIPGDERGGREAMADFYRTTARMRKDGNVDGAARAERSMHDYLIGKAMDAFETASGKVSPARLQAWLRRYEFALERNPDVRQKLGTVARAQDLLDSTRNIAKDSIGAAKTVEKATVKSGVQRIARQRKEVENSAAALYANMDPDEAITPALKRPEAMRQLTGRMESDPEAMAGLRRAAWRNFRDSSFKGEMGEPTTRFDPRRAKKWLERNRASMEILYEGSKYKVERLDAILDAGERMLGDLPGQTRGRIREARGDSRVIDSVWRMTRARAQGGAKMHYAAEFVQGLLEKFPSVGAQELIEEALLNPEVAALLLTRATPSTRKSLGAKLTTVLARMTRDKAAGTAVRAGVTANRERTNRTALP